MSTTRGDSNQGGFAGAKGVGGLPPAAEAAGQQGVQPLSKTFRRILRVVFLIFVFAVVQMFMLWRVCNAGMKTAASLEHRGLPTLNNMASLQEHLAIYRLNSYECLFAREGEKAGKAKDVETVAAQMRAELKNIKALLPQGEDRLLASNLEEAINDLDTEFGRVRGLVDSDFAAAMKAMDQNIPPVTGRVAAAANALKDYGYHFSGGQANATFGSFGWIKRNATLFGAGNILVAFGAVLFILLAARRSRAQLADTLARLDQRTQELAGSLSVVHGTLEATADGILLIDMAGRIGNFNQQFLRMWRISDPADIMQDKQRLMAYVLPLVERSDKFARKMEELAACPDHESFDVLELNDTRVFECCSKPQRIQDRIRGRVWSFRDVTERKRSQESQRLQSAALEAAANAIVITDQSGNILWVNAAFTSLSGYTAQEAAGQNPRFLKSGKQNRAFYRNLWQTISSGQVWSGELTNRRKDGSLYVEDMTITPLRNADGAIARYIAIKQDITERKRAENALHESKQKFQDIFESSRDAIMTMEPPSWKFTSGNPAAVKMFGAMSEENFTSHNPWELSPERQPDGRASVEKAREMIETAMREGSNLFEWTHRRSGGEEFPATVLLSRMCAAEKVSIQATVRDMTESKRAQVELEIVHKQLVESSRLAGMAEIASSVLHNVGNVLNSVNISTGLIVDSVKNSKASSLARVVVLLQEHAHDLGAFLTNDPSGQHVPAILVRLSEHLIAEQGKIVGELDSLRRNVEHIKEIVAMQQNYAMVGGVREAIDLVSLVEDSLRLNEEAFRRHGVEVVRELEKVPPMNVEKHKILQILVNLVRNAKYACDDSKRADGRLTVRVANGDGRVKISVIDNGIGIPPENLTRVFNYGFTTRKGGHGFGLHNSALAAKEMGGSLTGRSGGLGQGAEFTLELPCPAQENSRE